MAQSDPTEADVGNTAAVEGGTGGKWVENESWNLRTQCSFSIFWARRNLSCTGQMLHLDELKREHYASWKIILGKIGDWSYFDQALRIGLQF